MKAGATDDGRRYPLAPLARHLGIELGGPGGGPRTGEVYPTGLTLLAEHLGVSYSTAQRAQRHGLTEHQADRYAVAAGTLPELLWREWAADVLGPLDDEADDLTAA